MLSNPDLKCTLESSRKFAQLTSTTEFRAPSLNEILLLQCKDFEGTEGLSMAALRIDVESVSRSIDISRTDGLLMQVMQHKPERIFQPTILYEPISELRVTSGLNNSEEWSVAMDRENVRDISGFMEFIDVVAFHALRKHIDNQNMVHN